MYVTYLEPFRRKWAKCIATTWNFWLPFWIRPIVLFVFLEFYSSYRVDIGIEWKVFLSSTTITWDVFDLCITVLSQIAKNASAHPKCWRSSYFFARVRLVQKPRGWYRIKGVSELSNNANHMFHPSLTVSTQITKNVQKSAEFFFGQLWMQILANWHCRSGIRPAHSKILLSLYATVEPPSKTVQRNCPGKFPRFGPQKFVFRR